MSGLKIDELKPAFILRAILIWTAAALILLLISSAAVVSFDMREASIGYISSIISFLSAFSAAAEALKGEQKGFLYKAIIAAAALCIVLLTFGFSIGKKCIDSSGILSVVSFTFSGALLGGVMSSNLKSSIKASKFRHRRRQIDKFT